MPHSDWLAYFQLGHVTYIPLWRHIKAFRMMYLNTWDSVSYKMWPWRGFNVGGPCCAVIGWLNLTRSHGSGTAPWLACSMLGGCKELVPQCWPQLSQPLLEVLAHPPPAFLEGLEGGSMGNMGSPPVLIWLGRHEPLMELCREVAPDIESAMI